MATDPKSNPPAADELANLRAENERLRAQLAAAGRPSSAAPQHTFVLSEGDRQELELYGVANINGRRMTRDEVLAEVAKAGVQNGIEIATPAAGLDRSSDVTGQRDRKGGVEGFDFIYPSVAPGLIDPAVAGTPGVNGPAADKA
jgi:uncharacterized small protein (DUF1192 family)